MLRRLRSGFLFGLIFFFTQIVQAQIESACKSIPGQWKWFTGGIVTIRADGTLVDDLGNDGTWKCIDELFGEILIEWRMGGYKNRMILNFDRDGLDSADPSQHFVKATKIQSRTPPPNNNSNQTISSEDSLEISRLMKRLSGDYTYTKQTHWPDGTVSDDGYLIATMSLVLNDGFELVQKYLKCKVSNPGWRTDGYVISANSWQHCDQGLHQLKWEEIFETAPLGQVDPSSIQIEEIEKFDSGSNLALSIGYTGYDPKKLFEEDKEEGKEIDEDDDVDEDEDIDEDENEDILSRIRVNAPPGFTILRCRNSSACKQMAADLVSLVHLARKYAPPTKAPSKK